MIRTLRDCLAPPGASIDPKVTTVAKNRQEIPRDERAAEIVTAAAELFLKQGYSSTTMADIGRRVGATPANVYWYYPSKDELFAAVMDRMLGRQIVALKYELVELDPLSRLVRSLADMRAYRQLHQAMHHRMGESVAVTQAHDGFLDWIRGMVTQVTDSRDVDDPQMVIDAVICVFEGVSSIEPSRTATELIRYLLLNLTAPRDSSVAGAPDRVAKT